MQLQAFAQNTKKEKERALFSGGVESTDFFFFFLPRTVQLNGPIHRQLLLLPLSLLLIIIVRAPESLPHINPLHPQAMSQLAHVVRRACLLLVFAAALLVLAGHTSVHAFRFTLVPGKVKCFTNEQPEGGRYEVRYRMMRSLTPFVSVAVTSRGGRVLMEHEMAHADAKEIVTLNKNGMMSICFHTAEKAAVAAVSMNVTLDIVDAEDAELTRMKRQRYSTSSPIALGAGKGSGALQQMQYISKTLVTTRASFLSLARADEDIQYSLREAERFSWIFVYVFVGVGILITAALFMRLRYFMKKSKLL